MPFPHILVTAYTHKLGWPEHVQPLSILHEELHPSAEVTFPSSHVSVPLIMPFPHTVALPLAKYVQIRLPFELNPVTK